jgi:hypothetical protein
MCFTFLGIRQFVLAGGKDAPCICEDQGKLITVFPVSQSVEEELTKKNIVSVLENLKKSHDERGGRIITIFPAELKTAAGGKADESAAAADLAWCSFFDGLSNCESFVETVNPGRLLKSLQGMQKLNIPDSNSIADSVPPRRFIIENPEAGGIYSKMFFTNVLINQLRGDKSRKLSAHEELWKAQSCGLFCSIGQKLCSNLIRNAAYSALLRAEQVTRDKGKFTPSLIPFDFNLDGVEEWLFQDQKINCYVQSVGGGIFELDYQPKAWNYLDTCGGRLAFADSILPKDAPADTRDHGGIKGARLCYKERYELAELDKVRRKLRLLLRQTGAGRFGNLEMVKLYQVKKDSIQVSYNITNRGTVHEAFLFAVRSDLSLPGEGDSFVRFYTCKPGAADAPGTGVPASGLMREAECLKIHDIKNEVQITLSSGKPFDGQIAPVRFKTQDGMEFYQAYCAMLLFPLEIEAGGSWEAEFTLKFSH